MSSEDAHAEIHFDEADRRVLASLADVLIPAGDNMPSASQAEVAGAGLDAVMTARRDMAAGLSALVARARGHDATGFVVSLLESRSPEFDLLAEFSANAYFLNPAVRRAIGYDGQTALPIDPTPDYLADGLLHAVIERGAIYRPTPP